MFDKARKIRMMEAALMKYEDDLMRKDREIREHKADIRQLRQMVEITQQCNDALAKENKRLAENLDVDDDVINQMWTERVEMMRRHRELQALQDENTRLWVENAILQGELAARDPWKALEISNRFGGDG